MHWHDLESFNWLVQCTWLMATDRYLISLASSCIGSFRGEPGIASQAMQSMQSAGGVHGLSAQIGDLRPLLCLTETEFDHRNFAAVGAAMWRSWHGRRSRVEVDGAAEKWSFLLYSYL